jgi:mRNA interferase YafQ
MNCARSYNCCSPTRRFQRGTADHALAGEWSGFRDCHLRADLVLIYSKPDNQMVALVRLGSPSELSF